MGKKLNEKVIKEKLHTGLHDVVNKSIVKITDLRRVSIRTVKCNCSEIRRNKMEYVKQVGNLDLDGTNVAENWRIFKQNFDVFATAIELAKKPEEVRIGIFLNTIGPAALETYNTFGLSEAEAKKYDSVVKSFADFCQPKKNEVYETFIFHGRNQKEEEPFDNFLMDLKKLVRTCGFENQDRMIRDRIVIGVLDERLQKRLLEKDNLTLSQAIDMARAAEATHKQLKKMQQQHNTDNQRMTLDDVTHSNRKVKYSHTNDVRNKSYREFNKSNDEKNYQKRSMNRNNENLNKILGSCKFCKGRHEIGRCPAFGKICNNCGKPNHFAIACMTKAVREIKLQNNNGESEEEEEFILDSLTSKSSKVINENTRWYEIVRINDQFIKFKLDTGADIGTLPYSLFKKLKNVTLEKLDTSCKVLAYGGNSLKCLGVIETVIICKNEISVSKFLIIEGDVEPLLSRDACIQLNLIRRVDSIVQIRSDRNSKNKFIEVNRDVFDGFGCFVKNFNIELKDNAKGVVKSARRVAQSLLTPLKIKLDSMCEHGFIEKVDEPSEWVSNLVIREKPNKTLRICIDPQELNKVIKQEQHPIPTFEELVEKLNGKKFFTVLDLKDGFYQVSLNKKSSMLCTFSTPFGCYRYKVLPFGINLAPEVFQKYNERNFAGIPGIHIQTDDILVGGETLEEHDQIVQQVLERARTLNIKFNKDKLQYRLTTVKYLGHIISENEIACDPDRAQAINKIEPPKNKKDLQKLLGMINYVRSYVPNLSQVSYPIRELLKNNVTFKWLPHHDKCLQEIKKAIVNARALRTFDITKEITIETDASQFGLGSCLMQEGKPIAFASRSLSDSETRFAQIEKELLAVVFACQKFHYYIYGRKITVRSDHKPLVHIMKKDFSQIPSSRLQRMRIRLLKYHIDLKYVPGKFLYVADFLSRYFNKEDKTHEIEDLNEVVIHSLNISESKIKEFQLATNQDPILSELKSILKGGWPSDRKKIKPIIRPYLKWKNDLFLENEIVFLNSKVIVPKTMQKSVLDILHSSHLGIEKTKARARSLVYWVDINKDIERRIEECEICQKYRSSNIKEPLILHSIPRYPFQKIGVDIFEHGEKIFLALSDYYSRFLDIILLKNKSAEEVKSKLKNPFSVHGIPKEIIADNVPFNSYVFKLFCKELDIKLTTSSPRYPQSNGLAEKSVNIAKTLVKKCIENNTELWLGLLEYRNTPLKEIDASPTELLMSRKTRTLIPAKEDLFKPTAIPNINKNINNKNLKKKIFYDKSSRYKPDFVPGQKVWVQDPRRGWIKALISSSDSTPRSYWVVLDNGIVLRRNSSVIRKR